MVGSSGRPTLDQKINYAELMYQGSKELMQSKKSSKNRRIYLKQFQIDLLE